MIDDAISERMVDCLMALFCAPGSSNEHEDPAIHRPRLRFEWRLGQWCLSMSEDNELLGWASWYRVSDADLESLRRGEQDVWVRRRYYPVLYDGPHCYIATAIVAPGAPFDTYRQLIDDVGALNKDARSLSGNLVKRDGRERFAQRWNDGSEGWWRARQNDWQRTGAGGSDE